MKSTAIVFAIAAASLGFSAVSSAQGNDRRGEQRYYRQDDRQFDQGQVRRNDRNSYYNARGPDFRRGGYIPREYRNRQYVVTDYRSYRLSPPPHGQQWVQVGPDYVLVAIATGLIAHIILSH